MGEGLLAKYMGKKKLIAETGAGQHGVALATAAAYFGLECEIHMGEVDIAKQAPNVSRMQILGATRRARHRTACKTLKEAVDSAFEAYLADSENSDLLHRLGGRPASVPDDGARLPAGRGHRGARAVPRDDRQPAGRRRAPASAAAPTRWASSPASSTTRCELHRRRAAGARRGRRRARRDHDLRHARASSTASAATCCRTRRASRRPCTRSPAASTTRASAPSTATSRTPAACSTSPATDDECRRRVLRAQPQGGHHPGARERPRRRPRAASRPAR